MFMMERKGNDDLIFGTDQTYEEQNERSQIHRGSDTRRNQEPGMKVKKTREKVIGGIGMCVIREEKRLDV